MYTSSNKTVKASEIIDKKVLSIAKQRIGKVEDIILTRNSNGEAHYVILSSGGFLGLGENSYAVPWDSIHYDTDEKSFILNINHERLKTAPPYNKNSWTEEFAKSIYDYYKSL